MIYLHSKLVYWVSGSEFTVSSMISCVLFPGCMAERLKVKLLESDKMVDLVAGPGKCVKSMSCLL